MVGITRRRPAPIRLPALESGQELYVRKAQRKTRYEHLSSRIEENQQQC